MSDKDFEKPRSAFYGALFLAAQLVILAIVARVALARLQEGRTRRSLPPMREHPLSVEPLYDRPDLISDETLHAVLHKLRPRLRRPKPKINHVDHALRFWGAEARFRDPECLSGEEMRDILLDHAHFAEAWGKEEKPLLECNEHCVGIRTQEGQATASHVDHTLAGLAEVGTPLSFPIQTDQGPATVRSLLVASLRTFDVNQVEYEWSALAYALYLESLAPFRDVNGQEVSFDRIAERIMRQRLKQGVCYGNHRLHALVVLLRVDGQNPILGSACREKIVRHLQDVTRTLIESQAPEGYWNQHWASGVAPLPEDDTEDSKIDPIARKILATGHTLEWWALAPADLLPPDDVVERAIDWLAHVVIDMEDEAVQKNYTFLSHVGRAVALWRGHFPAHFIQAMEVGYSP